MLKQSILYILKSDKITHQKKNIAQCARGDIE